MPVNNDPSVKSVLLLLLSALGKPVSLLYLAEPMGISQKEALVLLTKLEKQGHTMHDQSAGLWMLTETCQPAQVVNFSVGCFVEKGHAQHDIAKGLALLHNKDYLSASEALLKQVRSFIHFGKSAAAKTCLDMLMEILQGWSWHNAQADAIAKYVVLIRCTENLAMYLAKNVPEALALLSNARRAAASIGDVRSTLLLDLTEACQLHLSNEHNTAYTHAFLSRTIVNLEALADSDILSSTKYAQGLIYFMQGECKETLRCLQLHEIGIFADRFDYFSAMGIRTAASAACSCGDFTLALGLMESVRRQSHVQGNRLAELWSEVQVADVLMRMGEHHKSLKFLDDVFSSTQVEIETRLWIWGKRVLAFYYYQRNMITESHAVLHKSMQQAALYGQSRPYYGCTWLFDMLWSYEEHDLPRIPGYDFEQELSFALSGPNKMFRAAALRIRAKKYQRDGAAPYVVAETLRQSLAYAEAAQAPLELARTCLALAQSYEQAGSKEEANALYARGKKLFSQHLSYDGIPYQRRPNLLTDSEELAKVEALTQCLEKNSFWTQPEARIQEIIVVICEELRIERGAIFSIDNTGGCTCLGANHITSEEIGSLFFEKHLQRLKSINDQTPEIYNDGTEATLYFPFMSLEGSFFCMMLENIYLPDYIAHLSRKILDPLHKLLKQELRIVHETKKRMEFSSSTAAHKNKEAAARIDASKTPYYGKSLQTMLQEVDRVAPTDASILILGETGVGKEVLAKRIHEHSGCLGSFIPVHPSSIPETLFESEFFGHEQGAFTGALRQRCGLVELADKGTLFIDELGDIPMSIQVKLLRVLQEKTFFRIGGEKARISDFRLVAATNRDLQCMVADGTFREDLYYRISVVPFVLPPLRERRDDILLLAQHFIDYYTKRYKRKQSKISIAEQQQLMAYAWPGNIRELKSVIERAVILSRNGTLDLKLLVTSQTKERETVSDHASNKKTIYFDNFPSIEEMQKRYIKYVLEACKGKIYGPGSACDILKIKRSTLYAKIKQLKLDKTSRLYGEE